MAHLPGLAMRRIASRVRGLLTGSHPALERAIGPKVSHPAVLEILSRCGGLAGIAKAGRCNREGSRARIGDKLVEAIMTALGEQTVTVPGAAAADTVRPRLADSLKPFYRSATGRRTTTSEHNAALICLARSRRGLTTR